MEYEIANRKLLASLGLELTDNLIESKPPHDAIGVKNVAEAAQRMHESQLKLIGVLCAIKEIDDAKINPNGYSLQFQMEFFLKLSNDEKYHQDFGVGSTYFSEWAAYSKNKFALAYTKGIEDGKLMTSKLNARRATNGRRLIGESSRRKVRDAAEKYRHLPKSAAAPLIAKLVNLSPENVRTQLSSLFPGESWKV